VVVQHGLDFYPEEICIFALLTSLGVLGRFGNVSTRRPCVILISGIENSTDMR
jgi:hypothetical protein